MTGALLPDWYLEEVGLSRMTAAFGAQVVLAMGRPRATLVGGLLGLLVLHLALGAWAGSLEQRWALFFDLTTFALTLGLARWGLRKVFSGQVLLNDPVSILQFFAVGGMGPLLVSGLFLHLLAAVALREGGVDASLFITGGTASVVVLAPMSLPFVGRPQVVWRPRRMTVAAPLLVSTVAIFAASWRLAQSDAQRLTSEVERQLSSLVDAQNQRWRGLRSAVGSAHLLFEASSSVEIHEFHRLSESLFGEFPEVTAFQWLTGSPPVPHHTFIPATQGSRLSPVVLARHAELALVDGSSSARDGGTGTSGVAGLFLKTNGDEAGVLALEFDLRRFFQETQHSAPEIDLSFTPSREDLTEPGSGEVRKKLEVLNGAFEARAKSSASMARQLGIIDRSVCIGVATLVEGLMAILLLVMTGHTSRVDYLVQLRTRQLENARQEAERAARAKSEFLANMSHEIRTPMNGVLGMAQLLNETSLSAKQLDYVRTILSSGQALLTVINEILDFSKLEAGQMKLVPAPFDPRALVDDVLELVAPRAREKNLSLSSNISNEVPPGLIGDSGRIRQVLINLVGNGVKFTQTGSVRVEVTVPRSSETSERHTLERVRFSVIDTGPGISIADQSRIFKAFAQVDGSSSRLHEGTGLGLAICKRITELLGGTIHVSSQPGRGSHFWIQIPLASQNERPATSQPLTGSHLRPLSGRVLIADDNRVNRRVASQLVASLGLSVDVVEDGREAVQAVVSETFDLVLMDCHMPVMDGFEATRRILRQLGPESPPIIALSASAMAEDVQRCIQSGMVAHLAKPISKEALWRTLRRYLPEVSMQGATPPKASTGQTPTLAESPTSGASLPHDNPSEESANWR